MKKQNIEIRKPTAKGTIVFKNKKRNAKPDRVNRKSRHKEMREITDQES